jgi:vacuolar-type H+-ATPase subunit F/Vma7
MNLRQGHNLLEENFKLKKANDELHKKLESLMIMLEDKMSLMVTVLTDIKNKETIQSTTVSSIKEAIKENNKMRKSPIFVPTPEPDKLKSNITDIPKKRKDTNLEDSVDQLTKLQLNNGK